MPPDTVERLKEERKETAYSLKRLQSEVWEMSKNVVAFEKTLAATEQAIADLEWPTEPEFEPFDDFGLESIKDELVAVPIDVLRKSVETAKIAAAKIETIDVQLENNTGKRDSLISDYNEQTERHSDTIEEEYRDSERAIEQQREAYRLTRETLIKTEKDRDAVSGLIDDLKKKVEELKEIQATIEAKIEDAGEWRFLETACGPNGIQALELDALAPSIAEVANRLLESAYDSRFKIEFRTTRIAGKGSKTKQVEDFEIMINDSSDGSEQALDTLSGGEGVWIKKAIYDAFGIIRAKNTGVQFLTVFLDEADGALDPEAKAHYLRMVEAAHAESGRNHTILITHSEAIQEMIVQSIVLGDL